MDVNLIVLHMYGTRSKGKEGCFLWLDTSLTEYV